MSKAYDSVNLTLLKQSLLCLALPLKTINTIIDLFTNRHNQVITNLGLTSLYPVYNGIDQDETITPLLWKIYYDPLITLIHLQFTGYSMQATWITNLKDKNFNRLETHYSALAYMDDTLWIASSQTELSQILSIAESFYDMANIQINPSKSILTTNNPPSNYNPIIFNNYTLSIHSPCTPFKFLGCWFTLNKKHSQQTQLIINESQHLIKIASSKRITDTHARYIINTVIIPTIEYRIQNIVLSQATCKKILTHHIGLVKQKAKLSRTIPTSTLLHPQLYNIYNIWDIQLQHHISNFIKCLNNTELLGISSRIHLQQLQNNIWSTTNILHHPNPLIDGPNKQTTSFKIIQLFSHLGLSVTPNPMYNIPYTVDTRTITLESILSSHSKYLSFKKQLRQHHILFLDQLTTYDNSCLLDWKHISPRIHKVPKGRKPLWFTTLEDITTNHSYYRTLYNHYQLPKINHFSYTTEHFLKSSKPWLITTLQDQIIIGKARRQPTSSGQILITHWHSNIELNATQLYPTLLITTTLCTGCNLNSNLITSKCTTFISINLATKFFGKFNTQNRQLNLNANYLDLLYSITI